MSLDWAAPYVVLEDLENPDVVDVTVGIAGEGHSTIVLRSPGKKCRGGGWAQFNHPEKRADIFGKSGGYGREPDRQRTLSLLSKDFPGYTFTERARE